MDYTKEFHMDQEEVLTTEVLEEFIQQHRTLVLRYEELDRMYRGEHPILGMEEKALFKPDNRLVVNYAKFIVDTFNGFFMGSPVKVTSNSDTVSEYLQLLERYNDIDDNNADLSKKCSIYGHAFELVFLDGDSQFPFQLQAFAGGGIQCRSEVLQVVSPLFLGVIHRGIGIFHQGAGILAIVRVNADADARAGVQAITIDLIGLGQ